MITTAVMVMIMTMMMMREGPFAMKHAPSPLPPVTH